MSDFEEVQITLKSVDERSWNRPGTQQFYYTVVTEEHPSEPTKFIQDRSKQAPDPTKGNSYKGRLYEGTKFYPDLRDNSQAAPTGALGPVVPQTPKREWVDNSDGIRGGMCFNNAAAYVSAHSDKKLTPKVWAEAVYKYAQALYEKGELKPLSGYDSFKASRPSQTSNDDDFQSMLEKGLEADGITAEEPINLDDIPF